MFFFNNKGPIERDSFSSEPAITFIIWNFKQKCHWIGFNFTFNSLHSEDAETLGVSKSKKCSQHFWWNEKKGLFELWGYHNFMNNSNSKANIFKVLSRFFAIKYVNFPFPKLHESIFNRFWIFNKIDSFFTELCELRVPD